MRFVLLFALIAVLGVAGRDALREEGTAVPTVPSPGSVRGLPPEMRDLYAGLDVSPQGALDRLLPGRRAPRADASGPAIFADTGGPRAVRRVKRAVRKALARAGSRQRRARVAAFQGVAVSGRRAIAVLDLRREVRLNATSRWRELPLQRRQVALARDGRRWRLAGDQ